MNEIINVMIVPYGIMSNYEILYFLSDSKQNCVSSTVLFNTNFENDHLPNT